MWGLPRVARRLVHDWHPGAERPGEHVGPPRLARQFVVAGVGLEAGGDCGAAANAELAGDRIVDQVARGQADAGRHRAARRVDEARGCRRDLRGRLRALLILAQVVDPGPVVVLQDVAGQRLDGHGHDACLSHRGHRGVRGALDLWQLHAAVVAAAVDRRHDGLHDLHWDERAVDVLAEVDGPGPGVVDQLKARLGLGRHHHHTLFRVLRRGRVAHAGGRRQLHAAVVAAGRDRVDDGGLRLHLLEAEGVLDAAGGDALQDAVAQDAAAEAESDLLDACLGVDLQDVVQGGEGRIPHAARADADVLARPPHVLAVGPGLVDERGVPVGVAGVVDAQLAARPPAGGRDVLDLELPGGVEREVDGHIAGHLVGAGVAVGPDAQAVRAVLVVAGRAGLAVVEAVLVDRGDADDADLGAAGDDWRRVQVEDERDARRRRDELDRLDEPVALDAAAQAEAVCHGAGVGVGGADLGQGSEGRVPHAAADPHRGVAPPVALAIGPGLIDGDAVGRAVAIQVDHQLAGRADGPAVGRLVQLDPDDLAQRDVHGLIAGDLAQRAGVLGPDPQARLEKLEVTLTPGLAEVKALKRTGIHIGLHAVDLRFDRPPQVEQGQDGQQEQRQCAQAPWNAKCVGGHGVSSRSVGYRYVLRRYLNAHLCCHRTPTSEIPNASAIG